MFILPKIDKIKHIENTHVGDYQVIIGSSTLYSELICEV